MQIDLAGRIRNIKLRYHNVLLPLFEAIINSIHAIEDAKINKGLIQVLIQRENIQSEFLENENLSLIENFKIIDNGIGFDERNYQSFLTSDSTFKILRGSKGVGRFLWLKAFSYARINSIYQESDNFYERAFEFSATAQGIYNYQQQSISSSVSRKTVVELIGLQPYYREKCPQKLEVIGRKILEHCISYFSLGIAPEIEVIDGEKVFNINHYFRDNLETFLSEQEIEMKNFKFHLKSLKFYGGDHSDHTISYCANRRAVKTDSLSKYIPDLSQDKKMKDEQGKSFTYLAFVSGEYLDENVNSERTDFTILEDYGPLLSEFEVSFDDLRQGFIESINSSLEPFLKKIREDKEQRISEYIKSKAPEYRPLLKYAAQDLNKIKPGLSENQLDIKLHELMSKFEISLKEKGNSILNDPIEYFEKYPEYTQKYHEFLEQYNDFGKSKLAKYIVHRKVILQIFEKNLQKDENGKYKLEKDIHEIIFPLRKTSDENSFEKQNLWIIDERLTYHHYLSSDRPLDSIECRNIEDYQRPDILIFNNPIAFVEGDEHPYSSIVIVEFKRPMRDNYVESQNPIAQVYNYIRKIKSGNYEDKEGRLINLSSNIPFYVYIICDLTKKIKEVAENSSFFPTPDLQGFFGYNSTLKVYIEILSFDKLVSDAKKRNNVLFKKLHLQ